MKLKLNSLKILTMTTALLPIVAVVSCGRDETVKRGEDLEYHITKEVKTFTFKKGNLLNSKNNQISDELKKKISSFNQDIEKELKKYKGKPGEVFQPLVYDFSKSGLTSFPNQIFKVFKTQEGIVKFPIELKLNNNWLTSFNFADLPINVVKVDLSHNKLSGKVPLKDIKQDYQGIYINLENNNYTTYDKNYLKTLKNSNSGIALIKDNQSWMNMYKPWNAVGLALMPDMKNFNEAEHSLTFPNIAPKNTSLNGWESVALIKVVNDKKYTRVLLSNNKIKW
ncbi:MAG: hypothetical protein HRT98_03255 [Mycoplasmatales bacterium]|nr:hypothetical protein [Mycoplasmatales bacterium]